MRVLFIYGVITPSCRRYARSDLLPYIIYVMPTTFQRIILRTV